MKVTYQAELPPGGYPYFSPEELAQIVGKRIEFTTPGGRPVRIFKVDVTDETYVFHAYG